MHAIRLLNATEIDAQSWNACVRQSSMGEKLPYAEYWSLDATHGSNWKALVLNDYEAVMPLPFLRRMRLKILEQFSFLQQLGIFSRQSLSSEAETLFYQHIPWQHFQLVRLRLHPLHDWQLLLAESTKKGSLHFHFRPNLLLPLQKTFEELKKDFSKNTKRNLKKAKKTNLQISQQALSVEKMLSMYEEHLFSKIKSSKAAQIPILRRWLSAALKHKKGFMLAVEEEGKLLAINFFLKSKKRIINILPVTTPEGKRRGAQVFLLANLIEEYAESEFSLDFEGSSIESIARFYRGFGASEEPYGFIEANLFAFPFRQLYQLKTKL